MRWKASPSAARRIRPRRNAADFRQEVSAPAFRIAIGSTKMRSCLLESLRVEDGRVKMSRQGDTATAWA